MTLFAKTVAERTRPGQRQDVEEQGIHHLSPSEHRKSHMRLLQTTLSTPTAVLRVSAASSFPITSTLPS